MKLFECVLLLGLIVCAVSVGFTRDLLTSIIIFMSYCYNVRCRGSIDRILHDIWKNDITFYDSIYVANYISKFFYCC